VAIDFLSPPCARALKDLVYESIHAKSGAVADCLRLKHGKHRRKAPPAHAGVLEREGAPDSPIRGLLERSPPARP
jgi:hypothetical protein